MSLSEQLMSDIKAAMKAREKEKLTLLRSVKSTFKNRELESGGSLTGAQEVEILIKMIKQRVEAAEGFRKGGAEDRAENEEREKALLEAYLPPAPSEEEIDAVVNAEITKIPEDARGPKSIGVVMKAVQAEFAGRPLDGKLVSQKIKAALK